MNTRTNDQHREQLEGTRPPSHLWCALFGKLVLNVEVEAYPRLLEASGVPLQRKDLSKEGRENYHLFLRHLEVGKCWSKVTKLC